MIAPCCSPARNAPNIFTVRYGCSSSEPPFGQLTMPVGHKIVTIRSESLRSLCGALKVTYCSPRHSKYCSHIIKRIGDFLSAFSIRFPLAWSSPIVLAFPQCLQRHRPFAYSSGLTKFYQVGTHQLRLTLDRS